MNTFTTTISDKDVLKIVLDTMSNIDNICVIDKTPREKDVLLKINFSSPEKLQQFLDIMKQKKIRSDFSKL